MLRRVGRWTPSILLAVLLALGLSSGAGIETGVIIALIVVQVLVIGLPKAAHQLGAWYGARGSADDGPEPAEG
jgi:hypothetical protein